MGDDYIRIKYNRLIYRTMAQVTQKRFFEIQPLNNVTEFTPSAGQDTIRFVIPPINLSGLDLL